jgi:ABC-type branched-subunit amino acid transport system substrate-binding protein
VDNVIELARPQDNQSFAEELLKAIQSTPDTLVDYFAESASETYFELLDLLVTKQKDYGPDAINRAPGGALNGVMVRIHDKYERLRHLTAVGIRPEHESIRDTYKDLANYAVIALMVIDGTWPRD